MSEATEARYVPAAGWHVFTRLFDPMVALTMRERTFRAALQAQVLEGLDENGTVVDVGAGTGTLAIRLAAAAPRARVIGVDPDPEILALARGKEGAQRVDFRRGLAQELPLPDAVADRLVMSLVLHHLEPQDKRAALLEARRVLRPGGRLHVADFGQADGLLLRAGFLVVQVADGFSNTRDHAAGRLPEFFDDGGFGRLRLHRRLRTGFGNLELLSTERVASEARAAPWQG